MTRFWHIAYKALGFSSLLSLAIIGVLFSLDFEITHDLSAISLAFLFAACGMLIGSKLPKLFPRIIEKNHQFYLLIAYGGIFGLGLLISFATTNFFAHIIGLCLIVLTSTGIAFYVFRIIGKLDHHDQSLYVVLAFGECSLFSLTIYLLLKSYIYQISLLLFLFTIFHSMHQYKKLGISPKQDAEHENNFIEEEPFVFSSIALFTTGVTGFLWAGTAAYQLTLNNNTAQSFIFFCICILLTTIIMLLDRVTGPHLGEDLLLKLFPVFSFFFLVLLPTATPDAKFIIACVCITLFTCDVIVNLLAIAEVARFNQISPALSFGKSLFYFFVGASAGTLLFADILPCVNQNIYGYISDILFLCVLCISTFVFKDNFPNKEDDLTIAIASITPPPEILSTDFDNGPFARKTEWKQKVDFIASEYHLTSRQKEVFNMLLKGRNAQFIADDFVISYSTAKAHIHNIYTKLGIHSQQDLISLVEDATPHKQIYCIFSYKLSNFFYS